MLNEKVIKVLDVSLEFLIMICRTQIKLDTNYVFEAYLLHILSH